MEMKRLHLVALAVLLLTLFALPLLAQDGMTGVTDDQVNAVAKKLYCPVCENITLDTCGTAACDDWRYEIELQLQAGKTEQQIIDDFVTRFGDRVVGTPATPILRALTLITPWVVIVGALVAVAFMLARRRTPASAAVETTPPADRYQEMLERDLAG
jgi:cytochrome c-type biogenesis protein CcmH